LHDLDRFFPQLRCEVHDVFQPRILIVKSRWFRRIRLRRGIPFAGYVAFGNGTLDNWPNRLARHTIEHKREALLRDLNCSFDFPSAYIDINQSGSSWQIPIPDAVMDGLEMPHALAGLGVEAKNAFTE